ncbi:alpha/beta hydrolase [Mesorhizobium koreense]|jgi:pimeloyl-ACP methyl ester carboxylesterase|uniref:alpha/beta hydrolase n=1 Tax=Mesorhizobium koreense TaxID=3074855 RepID=UPI00287B8450|nr:alpha/beta hydrolase [Mesorhizobium sp. WR6]
MKPLVFNDTIGWLKEADGDCGVVIAGAHGFEDLCSRRFLTLLADHIAQSGSPVLQFDYPGCGDAAGDHAAPGRVAAWVDSIGTAADELKRQTGVTQVIVIGFRLGALLAPLAVERRDDIAGLVLLAPPASGKAYVREMTALSRMIDAALPSSETGTEPFDGRTVAGFRLSTETLSNLGALGWPEVAPGPSGLPVLVVTSLQTPALSKWAGDSAGLPASVVFDEFEGYGRLMCDPTANRIPASVIERCADWVRDHSGEGHSVKPVLDIGVPALRASDYEEEPVVIGPTPNICGVLCRPAGGRKIKDTVLFLNSGAVPHVGWARGTVESARMLATEGLASLRIDLPGLGQSDAPREERLFLYDARGSADVSCAIDWLERNGLVGVSLAGICSGAFQAFHAARADKRVHRLVMINPLCFSWNSSYALDMTVWKAYEAAKADREFSKAEPQETRRPEYLSAFKMVTSKNSRLFVRRGLEAIKTTLANARPSAFLHARPVERWMRDLADRGVHVLIATSEGDLSLKEIDRHFGPDGERLRTIPNIGRLLLRHADHTLTPVHARHALVARLAGHIGDPDSRPVRSGWNGDPAAPAVV